MFRLLGFVIIVSIAVIMI